MVAWETDEGSYWVSNTLIETLSNEDMLKIAEGFRQLPGPDPRRRDESRALRGSGK